MLSVSIDQIFYGCHFILQCETIFLFNRQLSIIILRLVGISTNLFLICFQFQSVETAANLNKFCVLSELTCWWIPLFCISVTYSLVPSIHHLHVVIISLAEICWFSLPQFYEFESTNIPGTRDNPSQLWFQLLGTCLTPCKQWSFAYRSSGLVSLNEHRQWIISIR